MLSGNVLLTGGTGTLGYAIAERVRREQWPCTLTIYSRDPVRQQVMRRKYPEYRYAMGDILDVDSLVKVAHGHGLIIHAAAMKHIPEAEAYPGYCYRINVDGSINVLEAAQQANVKQVLAISTDKACHPINTYGCTKLMMERYYQHMAGVLDHMQINLCRYGNVLGSTGSVLKAWSQALESNEKPKITDPNMTRFWLTDQAAVDLILYALTEPSGTITIPRLPGLSMGRMFEYLYPNHEYEAIGLRPGEKMHEELLTRSEWPYMELSGKHYMRLWPVTGIPDNNPNNYLGYTSDIAQELTRDELLAMVGVAA